MTSLILENADLNRLFPKCRPKNGATQAAHNNHNNQLTTVGCSVAGLQPTHAELPSNNRNNLTNHQQHNHHHYPQKVQVVQQFGSHHRHQQHFHPHHQQQQHHHHSHQQNQNQQLSILDVDEIDCSAAADMISNISNNNNQASTTTLTATIATTTSSQQQQTHRRPISPHDMIDLDRDPTTEIVR